MLLDSRDEGGADMQKKAAMHNFLTTDLYAITSEEHSLGRNNVEVARQLVEAGIKVLQYREKDKKARQMYQECLAIRDLTRQAGVTFIVNDHIDLALLVEADGIHIGQDDLPVQAVRRLIGNELLLGLSTHKPHEAEAAAESGVVDYIGVGPIFSTATKKDVCAPVGFEYLRYVVEKISLPFVAIGGIKEHNIAELKQLGVSQFALITELVGAADIKQAVQRLRQKLKE